VIGILDEAGNAVLDQAGSTVSDETGPVPVTLPPAGAAGSALPALVFTGPLVTLPPAGTGGAVPGIVLVFGTAVALHPASGGASFAPALIRPYIDMVVTGAGGGAAAGSPPVIRFEIPPPPAPVLPAWQRDHEGWAVARERLSHVQALWQYGELSYFALQWHIQDHEAGLVPRCWRCWDGENSAAPVEDAENLIASAYGQGNQYLCPVCYGTTFALPEGASPLPGLRALIVRPAVWSEFDRSQQYQARGVYDSASVNVESVPDFRVRAGDWAFRADGARFYLRAPRRTTLRTGFGDPWQQTAAITYNMMQAALESPQSAAYRVPPALPVLARVLGSYTRVPADYSWAETVNAALIPLESPPPAASGSPQGPVTFPLAGGVT
jgi:hypothetical protein